MNAKNSGTLNSFIKRLYVLLMRGVDDIKQLTRTASIAEKLMGINMIVFRFVLSIGLSGVLKLFIQLHFLILFLIAFLLSTLVLLLYSPLIEYIAYQSRFIIEGLRLSIIILSLDSIIGVVGLLFENTSLILLSLAIIILQLSVFPIANIPALSKPVVNREVPPEHVLKYIGNIPLYIGVFSLIFDLVFFAGWLVIF